MLTKNTWRKGFDSGFKTTWILGKIVFPVTFIVTVLKYTPVIDWITYIFTPLMNLIGLPQEAAIPLALGNIINLYAAIGAILSLDLTIKNVFILAVMLSFSHNLIIETAVAKRIGIKPIVPIAIRLGLAFLSAFLINILWTGGQEQAQYGTIITSQEQANTWLEISLIGLKTALAGLWQIAIIVFPVMIAIQVMKDLQVIKHLSKWLKPLTNVLGLSSSATSIPLLAGLIFGLAYGAGVIIDSAKEENLPKKDLYLLSIFLVSSHAVFEDTLIFIPLGINVIPLLVIRVVVAFLITVITAKVWQRLVGKVEVISKGEAK